LQNERIVEIKIIEICLLGWNVPISKVCRKMGMYYKRMNRTERLTLWAVLAEYRVSRIPWCILAVMSLHCKYWHPTPLFHRVYL